MDSGLGSDEDRRSRTKEQKQLRNQQLLSGCFIDAASLSDDAEIAEQRRHDERRQGALIFQSSIPQFSMLQMSEPESGRGTSPGPSDEPDTPYNSIVQLDSSQEVVRKSPLGFYVDLSEVENPPQATPASSSHKKNIFSMVIDFEAPKKGKPAKLSSSTLSLKRMKNHKHMNGKNVDNINMSSSAICIAHKEDEAGPSTKQHPVMNTRSMINVPVSTKENGNDDSESSSIAYENGITNELEVQKSSACSVEQETNFEPKSDNSKEEMSESCNNKNINDSKDFNDEPQFNEKPQYVKLSDLEWQKPKPEISLTPRMSRSIPESSWVESPLLMSRSAGYKSAPHPLEPEPEEMSDSCTSTGSQPKRYVRKLGTDLLRMFLEEISPDVTVEVEGRKIKAHKCILASRCQYFAALLSGNWLEASGNIISLHGFSYEAVYFALCHVYSGAAHVPDSISLVELASLGDMLGLEGLKEVVEHALKQRHCHHFHKPCAGCCTGVLEVLPLAAAYGLDDLYQKCLHWITQHFIKVWPCRTFASLPRELRDKCYQQHVVHMTPDKVLDTAVTCDRILSNLPTVRWAEPVGQLVTQLSDACHLYLRQHFAAFLQTPSFFSLDSNACLENSSFEERILNAAKNLSIEQGCRSYARICKHLEKPWSRLFTDFLNKLKVILEQGLVTQSDRLIRSNAWLRMDSHLRARIKELTPTMEPISRLPRATPKRKPGGTNTASTVSSSDSSRNSSPGINNPQSSHSPSLRRSLLLAARTPQVFPSPSTVRRSQTAASPSATRRSTLTQPTQSSAAKSAPSRNIKPPKPVPLRNTTPRISHSARVTQLSSKTPQPTLRKMHASSTTGKQEAAKKPLSRCSSPMKGDSKSCSPCSVSSPVKEKKPMAGKKPVASKDAASIRNKPTASEQPPVTLQRSSTFLKDEPTVLHKIK